MINQEQFDAAVKATKAEKPKDNFMIIEFRYDHKFVLPHKDGVALLASMANAERLQDGYNEPKRILELDRESISTRQFSRQEYERYKMAAILGVSPDDIKKYADEAAQAKYTKDTPPP